MGGRSRPHGFRDILPQTYNDVGLWLSGASSISDDGRFIWDAYAVNGLLGEEGDGIRSMRDNGPREGDLRPGQ